MTMSIDYLAGLFDGEGSVIIKHDPRHNAYVVEMLIVMTDIALVEDLKVLWGGSVYKYTPKNPKWAQWARWYIQGRKAEPLLRQLRPSLRVKGPQVDVALQLIEDQAKINGRKRLTVETLEYREGLKNTLHSFKTKGSRANLHLAA